VTRFKLPSPPLNPLIWFKSISTSIYKPNISCQAWGFWNVWWVISCWQKGMGLAPFSEQPLNLLLENGVVAGMSTFVDAWLSISVPSIRGSSLTVYTLRRKRQGLGSAGARAWLQERRDACEVGQEQARRDQGCRACSQDGEQQIQGGKEKEKHEDAYLRSVRLIAPWLVLRSLSPSTTLNSLFCVVPYELLPISWLLSEPFTKF
jgi:hypothetical protein